MWMRRRYRFIFAAEMANARAPFGFLADQLNRASVLPPLASLECAGYAIRYHDLLVSTPADYARARFPIDYHNALSEVQDDARRALSRDSATSSNTVRFTAGTSQEPFQRFPKGKSRPSGKGKAKGNAQKGKKGSKRSGANAISIGKGANNTAPATAIPTGQGAAAQ